MAAATATRPRKKRQKPLPGMEAARDSKIESLALDFVEKREAWQEAKKPMTDARDKVGVRMKQLGLKKYEFDGYEITIETDEKPKVRRVKKGKDDAE